MQEGVIRKKDKKARWQAAIVFILPFLLFGLAWFMYFSGQLVPEGRTNKGELILPPAQFEALGLYKDDQPFQLDDMDGRWAIVVFGSDSCANESCQQVMYKTRQVHVGLGREADRVRRLYVSENQPALDSSLEDQHPGVLWLKAEDVLVEKALSTNQWPENRYFIIDPLGNIMMSYEADQEGGDLLKDLQKLLKASSIG